ncbi:MULTISPECIES: PD-(D/E)XK nuclease family protein [Bacillus]|uniref:PD-(D/E)XK nuclease family protein n=1 Tax=Bacillus TaxID=1386 RepID=UPI000BB7DB24|nr:MULTISPECIES: PD-(D/E)XK nuclease family protein [Bacillus]
MYIEREYPSFSWSNSRHKTLLDCKRKYYYHYYESHNGWSYDALEENKSSYRLKNLTNLPIILGEELHNAIDYQIKRFIAGKSLISKEEMIEKVSRGLNKAYIDSTKHKQYWFNRPKRYKMLHEIYYEQGISSEEIAVTKEKLYKCVQHFFESETYQGILNNLELQVLESEEFKIFEVNGVDVYVVLDFVYKDVHQGKWVVIDWKTGKESEEDKKQLAFYALYLSQEHNITIEDIVIRNEYLQTGISREYKLTQQDINHAEQTMNNSIYYMLQLLEDKGTNKPLSMDYFEMNLSRRCEMCNFKEKCHSKELGATNEII